jgi:hypothetical protein
MRLPAVIPRPISMMDQMAISEVESEAVSVELYLREEGWV